MSTTKITLTSLALAGAFASAIAALPERASAEEAGVEPWPPGERELFLRIVPHRVTGRRIQPA